MHAEDVRAFVRLGAYESLLAGVGACWDHYYHAEAIAQGMLDVGICGTVAPTLQDRGGPGQDQWQSALNITQALSEKHQFTQAGIYPVPVKLGPNTTAWRVEDIRELIERINNQDAI